MAEQGQGRTPALRSDATNLSVLVRQAEVYGNGALPEGTELLFAYKGLHGAVHHGRVNVAHNADLKIGVVPGY